MCVGSAQLLLFIGGGGLSLSFQRTAAEQKLLTEQKAMAELSKEKSGMARSIESLKEALSSTRSQLETTKASLNATTTSLHQEMNKVLVCVCVCACAHTHAVHTPHTCSYAQRCALCVSSVGPDNRTATLYSHNCTTACELAPVITERRGSYFSFG